MTQPPSSSGSHWRSEEDYFLARLAVSMGILDQPAIEECLRRQGLSYAAGQPLSLSQVMLRDVNLPPHALMRLKSELMRCHHRCAACGYGRYLAPGPQARSEPCPKCGGEILVAAAGSSMTASRVQEREQAMALSGSFRMSRQKDPLAASGQGPRLFGNYVLDEELARGGMGAVYRVRHTGTGNSYALKVLLAGTKASKKQLHRFRRESKAQMELDHPNIVKIHDAGEWEGILYYAMEIIDGGDLDSFKEIEREERYRIMAKVCRAIHAAHEKGYIHRDLKPANILIDSKGEPLVTDFGLTKNLEGTTQLTQEGAVMGTPFYMSPEQATGQASAMGTHSDIFSLGVLLYQMATEELPFEGASAVELYRAIVQLQPKTFAEHDAPSPKIERVALKAMEKEPELRYPTALEMAEDIERVLLGENPLASSVSSAARVVLKVEQHKRSIGFILGTVVVGLVSLVGLLLAGRAAYTSMKATQALEQREADAKATIAAFDQGLASVATMPTREALRALEEALKAADDLLVGEDVTSSTKLRLRRREGLVAHAVLSMALGTGSGATAALASLDAIGEGEGEVALAALDLRARASWRLGRAEAAEAALVALAKASANDPRVALLEALRARLAGEPAKVLAALGDGTTVDAALERGAALLALGKEDEAAKVIAAAEGVAKPSDRLQLRWGEALLALGRTGEAADVFAVALERDAGDVRAARRLTAVCLTLGRPVEAAAMLNKARKKQAGLMELDVEWLRARLRCDREASEAAEAKLGELVALPGAALLVGDLAALAGEAEPYTVLAAPSLRQQATVARSRVDHGQDPGDLSALAALMDDVPQDVAPDPELARAVRDLGWVYAAKAEPKKAQAAAEAALRGLPGDLDACFLLCAVDPAHAPRLAQAFVAEADELQGALGRGLLLSRLARLHGLNDLVEPAQRLLRMRLVGDPSLWVVRAELARLATFAGTETAVPPQPAGSPDWNTLLPPLPDRTISRQDKAKAKALALKASEVKIRRPGEAARGLEFAKQALAVDPFNLLARHEQANLANWANGRQEGRGRLLFVAELELRPGWAFGHALEFISDWIEDARYGTSNTPADEARIVLADDPEVGLNHTLWIFDRYMGILYPEFKEPAWTRGEDPRAVTRRIGLVLRKAPLMTGLLYHHAHMVARQRRFAEVERDFTLLDQVLTAVPEVSTYWDWIYRAWILAEQPLRAWVYLDKLVTETIANKPVKTRMGDTVGKLLYWFENTPSVKPLTTDPRWEEFEHTFFGDEKKKQR